MTLEQLKEHCAGESTRFTADTFGTASGQQFFRLLGCDELTVRHSAPVLSEDKKSLTLKGSAAINGWPEAPLELVFKADDKNKVQPLLTTSRQAMMLPQVLALRTGILIPEDIPHASLPQTEFPSVLISVDTAGDAVEYSATSEASDWELFQQPRFRLREPGFRLRYTLNRTTRISSYDLFLHGLFRIGQSDIRCGVYLPLNSSLPNAHPSLSISSETPLNKSLEDISSFLLGAAPQHIFPASFFNAPQLYLTQLTAALDWKEKKISRTSLELAIRDPWTIADQLAVLNSATLKLDLNPGGSFLGIAASVSLGQHLDADVSIDIENLAEQWNVRVEGGCRLPCLRQLSGLSGSLDIGSWGLPASLLDQQLEIQVEELSFELSPKDKKINSFALEASSKQMWEVLPGVKVGRPALGIRWEPGKAVTGFVSGELRLRDNLDIVLEAEKTGKGFVLNGNFEAKEPLTLQSVLSTLFPGFSLPEGIGGAGLKKGKIEIDTAAANLVLTATLSYGRHEFEADFSITEGNTLKAGLRKLALKDIVETLLALPYPEELPAPVIEYLELSLNKKQEITFKNKITDEQGLSLPGAHLQVTSLEIEYSRKKKDEGFNTEATLKAKGRIDLEQVIVVDSCVLDFQYAYDAEKKKAKWSLSNDLKAHVFGKELALKAFYKDEGESRKLGFDVTSFPELGIPGVATYTLKNVSFLLLRKENKEKKTITELTLSAKSSFATELFSFEDLAVSLHYQEKSIGLELKAGSTEICLLGKEYPWFELKDPTLKLLYQPADKTWSCEGSSSFIANNIPATLKQVFPANSVTARFRLGSKEAEIGIHYDGMYRIPLPPKIDGVDLSAIADIGDAYIGVNDLKIDFRNGGKITALVNLGLPKNLNKVFANEEGKPRDIFRVYDPEGVKDTVGFSLSLSKKGLSLQLESSPFKNFFKIEKENGKSVLHLDLGDCGAISVLLPEFSLKADGSLRASGGFHIKKELSIPLSPLTLLLRKMGLGRVADVLKPRIPLRGVSFATKKADGHYEFHAEAFLDLFMDTKGKALPQWLKDAFNDINRYASKLPDSFLDYTNIEIPDRFYFDIEYTVTNSLRCQLSVKDPDDPQAVAKPIKLILPQFPVFMGIKLYSISFGELFSGALFRLDVDAELDSFDLPSLVASVLIPHDEPLVKQYLPELKDLRRTFILRNLTVLIVYQTGVPIPIPLFFDKLGISSLTLDGMEVQSSFEFPMPVIGLNTLKDFALIISELVHFFRDRKPLDWDKLKKIDFIHFTVGPNYIRLPKYVSRERQPVGGIRKGKLLGTEKGFTLNPVALFCAIAEAIDKGSINKLIRNVELDRRVGDFEMTLFDVLDINCKYAFTTPFEFINDAYPRLGLSQQQEEQYLKLLPAPRDTSVQEQELRPAGRITADTEGLVIFMNGKVNAQDFVKLDAGFGFAATAEGLGIGGKFEGKLGKLSSDPERYALDILLQGIASVKKGGGVRLEGQGHLLLLGYTLLKGKFLFHPNGIELMAQAGEPGSPIYAMGHLSGRFANNVFLLKGDAELVILGFSAKGSLCIDASEEQVNGVVMPRRVFELKGDVQLGSVASLKTGISYVQSGLSADLQLWFNGRISHVLDLDMKGALQASPSGLLAAGRVKLDILDRTVFDTAFAYNGTEFRFEGRLDLLPWVDKRYVEITGTASGAWSPQRFYLEAHPTVKIMGYSLLEAHLYFDQQKALLKATFFELQTVLLLQREPSFRLYGSMQAVRIGPHFSITAPEEAVGLLPVALGGPELYIADRSPYFSFRGRTQLLGITTEIRQMEIREEGFLLETSGKIFDLLKADLRAEWNTLYGNTRVELSGQVQLQDITGELIDSIHKTAREIMDSLEKARQEVETARQNVSKAADAIAGNIKERLAGFRRNLEDAQRFLSERQNEVNRLGGLIDDCHARIRQLKEEIEHKKSWYDNSAWYEKSYRWIELSAYVAPRGLEIGERYVAIGIYEGLRYTAIGLLEAAKETVRGVEVLIQKAESSVDDGLKAFKDAADLAFTRAKDALIIVSNTVGMFESWSTRVLGAAGQVLTIHSASFVSSLSEAEGGAVLLDVDLTFLGERKLLSAGFVFTSTRFGIDNIVNALKQGLQRPDTMAIEARKRNVPVLDAATAILKVYPMMSAAQMCVALLRAGYNKSTEVQAIALKELYVKQRKVDVREIVDAVMAGERFLKSYKMMN